MAQSKAKSILKKVFLVLLVLLVSIQFIRPKKNISDQVTAEDMNTLYPIPDSVTVVLKKACYDCHSNNTRYPWCFNIQPVAIWMNNHIDDGKKQLNFSEFGKRSLTKRAKKLKKLAKEVEEGDMPLDSYTWIHKDAILTEHEKKLVIDWANSLSDKIVADSIKAKG